MEITSLESIGGGGGGSNIVSFDFLSWTVDVFGGISIDFCTSIGFCIGCFAGSIFCGIGLEVVDLVTWLTCGDFVTCCVEFGDIPGGDA